ncbi:hypothetical protein EV127DRAFT_103306 [Xylaria flabelliformis]|nr:hypothetical protein EV127DRAFT_103306 [Xylaria flabelliformis]
MRSRFRDSTSRDFSHFSLWSQNFLTSQDNRTQEAPLQRRRDSFPKQFSLSRPLSLPPSRRWVQFLPSVELDDIAGQLFWLEYPASKRGIHERNTVVAAQSCNAAGDPRRLVLPCVIAIGCDNSVAASYVFTGLILTNPVICCALLLLYLCHILRLWHPIQPARY